jgi:hypothetical protein
MTVAGKTDLKNNTAGLKTASSDFKSLVMKRYSSIVASNCQIKDDLTYNLYVASLSKPYGTSDTNILKGNKCFVRKTKAKKAVNNKTTTK